MENAAEVTNAGERVFDITVGDQSLARNLDIIGAEGGPNRVHFVSGTIDHQADSVGGPIVVNFRAARAPPR